MDALNWKLEKIRALSDEVKDLHPVLQSLFESMPTIRRVIYTQGNRENGADFVLIKEDELLNQEEYVGVVVKSSQIKQGSDDVSRQIKECTLMARPIEGGKKFVHLTEVWVVTSKDITRNAQDFINAEYKSTKLKFIDAANIVSLVDRFMPTYWEFSNANVNKYIDKQKRVLDVLGNISRLLPKGVGRVQIEQEIERIPPDYDRNFGARHLKPGKLWDEIQKNKLIFLEGGMGAGKSDLLRTTALKLCDGDIVHKYNKVPYYTTYRDLIKSGAYSPSQFLDDLHAEISDDSKNVVIFIDGLDESQESNATKIQKVCDLANAINNRDDTALVVASRVIDEEAVRASISKSFDQYRVKALTYGAVVNFVQKICESAAVSNKLRQDLQKSPLMRALPRTPLSAILLGKLLKENINELPSTLPELYSKYVELVLGRWDLQKGGGGSEKEYETMQRLTAMIATYMLNNDIDCLGLNELTSMFKAYLSERRTGQLLDPMVSMFLAKSELISFDSDARSIRFRHKSFSEFFYAHALLMEKGKEAPIFKPFDPNWTGIEYFYLGLVRDVPERIDRLSSYVPADDAEEFIKFSQFGSFLMAGYQTPYETIKSAVYKAFRDGASHYQRVASRQEDSWLSRFPELQLLALFTHLLRRGYAYDFFRPALVDAKVQAELDSGLDQETQIILIFLIDAVLCELGDPSAFTALVDRHQANFNWVVRLGIKNAAADVAFVNEATRIVVKKMDKTIKNNRGIMPYIRALANTPLDERKE